MSRPRSFSKAEIFDAARAAAESGLSARLYPSGEIEFTHMARERSTPASTRKKPEELLQGWLDENATGRRA